MDGNNITDRKKPLLTINLDSVNGLDHELKLCKKTMNNNITGGTDPLFMEMCNVNVGDEKMMNHLFMEMHDIDGYRLADLLLSLLENNIEQLEQMLRYRRPQGNVSLLTHLAINDSIDSFFKFFLLIRLFSEEKRLIDPIEINDALIESACIGDQLKVTSLLAVGGDPYAENKYGDNAFGVAAENNDVDIMKIISDKHQLVEDEALKALAVTLKDEKSDAFNYLMNKIDPVKIAKEQLATAFMLAVEGDDPVSLNKLLTLWQKEEDQEEKTAIANAELEALHYAIINRKLKSQGCFPLERYNLLFEQSSDYESNPRYIIYLAVEHGCAGLIEKMEQLYLKELWAGQLASKIGNLLNGVVDNNIVRKIPFGRSIGNIAGSILSQDNLGYVSAMVPFSGYKSIIARNKKIEEALDTLYLNSNIEFEDMKKVIRAVYNLVVRKSEEMANKMETELGKVDRAEEHMRNSPPAIVERLSQDVSSIDLISTSHTGQPSYSESLSSAFSLSNFSETTP